MAVWARFPWREIRSSGGGRRRAAVGCLPRRSTCTGATPVELPTYWCYVYNAGITNLYSNNNGYQEYTDAYGTAHLKGVLLNPASEVPILCQHMMTPAEVTNIIGPSRGRPRPRS